MTWIFSGVLLIIVIFVFKSGERKQKNKQLTSLFKRIKKGDKERGKIESKNSKLDKTDAKTINDYIAYNKR